jgi:hypothetical protein
MLLHDLVNGQARGETQGNPEARVNCEKSALSILIPSEDKACSDGALSGASGVMSKAAFVAGTPGSGSAKTQRKNAAKKKRKYAVEVS